MRKKIASIPVNHFATDSNNGISIEKVSLEELTIFQENREAHRHDAHTFILLEKGTVSIEIDFKKYEIKAPSLVYMNPNQVHLILKFTGLLVYNLAITNENLNPDYLHLLEEITPAKPLKLKQDSFAVFSSAASLCISYSERARNSLYNHLLKDSCNAFVALTLSEFIDRSKPIEHLSRFELVTKRFKTLLEQNYIELKRPADYAGAMNISVSYLNECVKDTTGHSVSYQIQDRVFLEAKRLLYHSEKSVKEIAFSLGYEDTQYFSRLFSKVVKMAPLSFRNKNRD